MSPNTIPLIVLAVLFFLLYKALRSVGERPFANLSEAEIALARWQAEHQDIHPGDYSSGRKLAERYRDALLAAAKTVPTMKSDPEYLAELKHATQLSAPRHSEPFHAVA